MANIGITALGAATSVGYDVATTCASIRAGLARPALVEEFEVLDVEEQEPVGLTACPMVCATFGFSGVGRWLQMADLALKDLCNSAQLPKADDSVFWSSTICYVVLPILDPGRFDPIGACGSEEVLQRSFVGPLTERCAAYFCPASISLLPRGRVGTLHAIERAIDESDRNGAERVVVLAVDSLVDPISLMWLAGEDRIKDDSNPVGLMPGEGAVAFMLEPSGTAGRRGASPIAHLAAVAVAREANAFVTGERSTGEAVAGVVELALTEAGIPLPYQDEVLTDLNGESWRSEEYGHARTRIPNTLLQGEVVGLPATSIGDIGAGMSALELAIACRSLTRGYARGKDVLFISSDEYGDVGAAVLRTKD